MTTEKWTPSTKDFKHGLGRRKMPLRLFIDAAPRGAPVEVPADLLAGGVSSPSNRISTTARDAGLSSRTLIGPDGSIWVLLSEKGGAS